MKLCLVCSSGGHFFQLYLLKDFWKEHDRFWVTFLEKIHVPLMYDEKIFTSRLPRKIDTAFVSNEKFCDAYHPTNRSIINFIRNLFLAFKILRKERPDVIISTGAGVGVPFIYTGRLLKIKTIFIESATRVNGLSLSGRLVYPAVGHFIVQWPELAEKYPKAKFAGRVI